MARGLTFDTGALIALERAAKGGGTSRAIAIWAAAQKRALRVTVPSAVVLEWWRGQRGPAARLLDRMDVEPLTRELAELAGAALARMPRGPRTRTPSIVDAVVVASAAQRGDVVYTSDVEDLERLRTAAFPSVRVLAV